MIKAIIKQIIAPIILLLFLAPSAMAHEKGEGRDLYALSLQDLLKIEITSPTLTGKDVLSVPASVTVFTRDQIQHMGADYLYELVNFVPGFQAFRQGTDGLQYFHSARGHRSSIKSREVLILLDGIRLIREADNGAAVPMLSLSNVKKIEFIRGPGSAIYGSNAFLGVINIETVRSNKAAHFALGEAERKQINTQWTYDYKDVQLDIAVNAFDEAGETYTLENINVSPIETLRASDPRKGGDIQLSASGGAYELNALISRRESEDFYIVERAAPEENRAIHSIANVQLARNFDWGSNLQSKFALAYSENAFKLNTVIQGLGVTHTNQQERNLQLTARNAWQYAQQNSLEFGLELRNSDMQSTYQSETLGFVQFYPDTDRTITGLYLQNQRYLNNGLQLILGGRYDHYSDTASSVSPRLGVIYPLNQQQTIKLLYGEAFRAPTPNELVLIGVTLSGNPNLKPEVIKTSELIWVGSWGKHTTSINGYYNIIESAIYSAGTFQNSSMDEEFYGVEIEYSFQPSQQWLFKLSGSYMEDLPESDFREADRLANVIINYNRNKWNINFNAHYAGERQMQVGSERVNLDDYWLVNSKWTYYVSDQTHLYLNGRNLLDESNQSPNRLTLHTAPAPNRGREMVLGVEFHF